MAPVVLAFDAYGTLLSTQSIATQLAEHFGNDKAKDIAQAWRKHQLEYTWRLNSMGQYKPFDYVTRQSLKNALAESAVQLSDKDLDALLKFYNSLPVFPDVSKTLEKLRSAPDMHAVVFSNGTQDMVSASITQSPDLKGHTDIFREIVVVEDVQKYKPAPEVYHHLAQKVDKNPKSGREMKEVWVISGNPFDIVGARAVGMNAIWVDRSGTGWKDGLVQGDKGRPSEIVNSLEQVVPAVMATQTVELTEQWNELHGERDT